MLSTGLFLKKEFKRENVKIEYILGSAHESKEKSMAL